MSYLWVNLCDLTELGTIPGFGSPLDLMLQEEDTLLPGYRIVGGKVDDTYILVQTTPDRAQGLQDALGVIGRQKIGRAVRCRISEGIR